MHAAMLEDSQFYKEIAIPAFQYYKNAILIHTMGSLEPCYKYHSAVLERNVPYYCIPSIERGNVFEILFCKRVVKIFGMCVMSSLKRQILEGYT